jgi:hypothetical protein
VQLLLAAEQSIRAMMKDDHAMIEREKNNPWQHDVLKPKLVNFGDMSYTERGKLAPQGLRLMGYPAMVKPGKGPDGQLYSKHPDVLAVQANVDRTAEAVAWKHRDEIHERYQAASSAYVQAENAEQPDAATIAKLKAEYESLEAVFEAATAECDRLSKDWTAASRIVIDEDGNRIGGDDRGPHLAE